MDPLSVLRDYTVRGDLDNVRLIGNDYHFGDDYSFRRNIETVYRSKHGNLYTLESLVFFVKNTHMKHTDYMKTARAANLEIVTYIDRKPLLDYLEGKVATNDAIQLLAPGAPGVTTEWVGGTQFHDGEPEDHGADEADHHIAKKFRPQQMEGQDNKVPEPSAEGKSVVNFREREWPVRDRETILLCHNKSFEGVLALLLKKDEDKKKADSDPRKDSGKAADGPMPAPNPASRYNVEEKRFWKEHLGTDVAEELGINPSQSYITDSKKKDASRMKPDMKSSHRPPHHSHHKSSGGANSKAKPDGPPIIIVPSASQTLLNTYNVKEFLEDGVYIAPDVKVKTMPKKLDVVLVQRKMGRERPVTYEVRDKIAGFSSKDWERVVAVFVLGKDWQFKDWPFKDRVEIFNKSEQLLHLLAIVVTIGLHR